MCLVALNAIIITSSNGTITLLLPGSIASHTFSIFSFNPLIISRTFSFSDLLEAIRTYN
jgi:hypothetical protein